MYEECGRWQDAAKCWVQAGEVGQAADIYLQSKDYSRAAPLLLAGGRYNDALECYRHWLSSVATSDTEGRIKALLGIAASLILGTAKPHKANEAYRSARELVEDEIDRDPFTAGRYWEVLGEYGVTIGRSDLIQLGYEKALSCYSADHNGERLRTAQIYLAAVRDNRLLAADIETRIAEWRTLQTEDEPSSKVIHLRSKPLTVSVDDFKEIFRLNNDRRPLEYIENDFEDRGEAVMDHATGLIWQKSGSDKWLTYEQAQTYIDTKTQEIEITTIDDIYVTSLSKKEFYNLKFRAPNIKSWSINDLKSQKILSQLKTQFQKTPDAILYFVTQSPCPIFHEIIPRGASCSSRKELEIKLRPNNYIDEWDNLKKELEFPNEEMISFSKQVEYKHVIDTEELKTLIFQKLESS